MMRAIGLLCSAFSLLTFLTDTVTTQSLSFVSPIATALTALGDDPKYFSGENVTISWSTDFEFTTLRVWQGPLDNGSYTQEILARNSTRANTTLMWKAAPIGNSNLTDPFHFELLNGHDSSCEGCTANSVTFYVVQQSASSTISSAATSSTSATKSTSIASPTTPHSTASETPTGSSVAVAAATNTASTSLTSSRKDLAVPLGVSLGVGIPVLLALTGLVAFCLLRRRKRTKTSGLPRGRQPVETFSNSQGAMRERGSREPIAPAHQTYAPYRALGYPRSSGVAASTNSSYFEPFEFERPGSQDFDSGSVMSEVTMGGASAAARLGAIRQDRTMTPNWPLAAR